ncbi:MAG: DsrE family protein [Gammaproteobacteria bacterium]|nr:DsrE family protein [Gammaproteobacteria bacterium]
MSTDHNLSDEQLSAFVDGQLDMDEKSRILGALNADEDLSRRACELRRLHDLVRHAYDAPPTPPFRRPLDTHGRGWRQAVAAALLLAMGGTAGWVAHARQHQPLNLQAMYLDEEKAFQTSALEQAPAHGEYKVLLHLSSAEPEKLERALDTAEQLLSTYRRLDQPIEVELVANAGGLELLRADISPFAERVRALQHQYDNLTFMACQTALDRLRRERHLSPDLLPEALITPNALEEILSRLQQGWVYISV